MDKTNENKIIDVLREHIEHRGIEILKNSKVINGILADYFPENEKERNAIKMALNYGIGKDFVDMYTIEDKSKISIRINQLKNGLMNNAWMAEDAAEYVTDIFVNATGLVCRGSGNDENEERNLAKEKSTPQKENNTSNNMKNSIDSNVEPAYKPQLNHMGTGTEWDIADIENSNTTTQIENYNNRNDSTMNDDRSNANNTTDNSDDKNTNGKVKNYKEYIIPITAIFFIIIFFIIILFNYAFDRVIVTSDSIETEDYLIEYSWSEIIEVVGVDGIEIGGVDVIKVYFDFTNKGEEPIAFSQSVWVDAYQYGHIIYSGYGYWDEHYEYEDYSDRDLKYETVRQGEMLQDIPHFFELVDKEDTVTIDVQGFANEKLTIEIPL